VSDQLVDVVHHNADTNFSRIACKGIVVWEGEMSFKEAVDLKNTMARVSGIAQKHALEKARALIGKALDD